MNTEEKQALANALGVHPMYLPDELSLPETSGGYVRGRITVLPQRQVTPEQRAAEERRDLAAIFGVNAEYVQLPVEEIQSS